MTARRGFTLLETVFAAMMGALVALTCVGLFAATSRVDRRVEERIDSRRELMRLRHTMWNSLQNVVMSDSTPPRVALVGKGEAADIPEELPRFILERDEGLSVLTGTGGRRTGLRGVEGGPREIGVVGGQRLEVALKRHPIFAAPEEVLVEEAITRASDERRRRELYEDAMNGVGRAPGVRGAFELLPDEDYEPGEAWVLWYRPVYPPVGDESVIGGAGVMGAAVVARGLRVCRWEVYRNDEFAEEAYATWTTDLPGFVTLEVETMAGHWAKWMFEVGWSSGPEPGKVLDAALAGAAAETGAEGDETTRDAGETTGDAPSDGASSGSGSGSKSGGAGGSGSRRGGKSGERGSGSGSGSSSGSMPGRGGR